MLHPFFHLWCHSSAKLENLSVTLLSQALSLLVKRTWICWVPEPLPEARSSTNRKPKKLRPASSNMIWQCGSESHNHPPPFPYGLVVSCLYLKSCLFWTCVHTQCHAHFFHHVEFYFRLRQLLAFPVLGLLCCVCQAEESSRIFSGNVVETVQIFVLSSFLRMSSFLRLSSFLRSSSLLRSSSFFLFNSKHLILKSFFTSW